ncbi:MAG TPA: MarR family transcriptional regulator [Calditrichaeota bacterium]|nr:MarR family transcriptional regulator [Calditrichota bacterium]
MPLNDSFTQSFPYIIHQLYRLIHLHINRAFVRSGYDISFDQFLVMVFLWQREGRTQQELSKLTSKDKASITRLIDGLVRRGLVERIPAEYDRRSKLIYLTRKGKSIQPGCYTDGQQSRERLVEGISTENLEITRRTLLKMVDNFQSKSSGEK